MTKIDIRVNLDALSLDNSESETVRSGAAPAAEGLGTSDRLEHSNATDAARGTEVPLLAGEAVAPQIVERLAALVETMGEINGDVAQLGDVDIDLAADEA